MRKWLSLIRRFRLTAICLAAGAVLSALTIWITTPLPASAGSGPAASAGSRHKTIDVITKTTSFRVLPNDGFIATLNLFDKRTRKQVGNSVFYCLQVQPVTSAGPQPPGECPGTAKFTGKGTISILGRFIPLKPGQTGYNAVVGGTGRYKYVRGQLKFTWINPGEGEGEGIWTLLLR
jgi:hypothetical protein